MSESELVDWRILMRFGLGVLGLAPRDFWNMTPSEFSAALEGRLGVPVSAGPLDRPALATLMRQNPDENDPMGSS